MRIGAYSWEHDLWQGRFYPDDLPREWRLGYYASQFSAVVVPFAEWGGLTGETAEEWRGDTSEAFRFYLELPAEGPESTEPDRLTATAALLGDRLGGFVADHGHEALSDALPDPVLSALAPVCLIAAEVQPEWADICPADGKGCRGPGRLAVRRCAEHPLEPAVIREMLERLAATGAEETLLWCGSGPDALQTMHQTRIIAELLGV